MTYIGICAAAYLYSPLSAGAGVWDRSATWLGHGSDAAELRDAQRTLVSMRW
jgi:hypothetical protein